MKRVEWVAGMGLMAAAAAAILLAAAHVARASRERPVRRLLARPAVCSAGIRLVPGSRPEAGHVPRRRCVRLGWKAPFWYAGA